MAREEKNCQRENDSIKIKREPLKLFFGLLQNEDKTIEDVEEFIAENPVNLSEVYRLKTAVDHAVCFSNFSIAKHLVKKYPDALSIPAGSTRENLMQLIRARKVRSETKAFILDPDEKIWEHFNDGTTELHVHAYVGRIEETMKILYQTPERLIECNNQGENVLYWAHYSDKYSELKWLLENISSLFLINAFNSHQWSLVLKFYQTSEKFIRNCLTPDNRLENAKQHYDLITNLKHTSENTLEKIAVSDYVTLELVNSYVNLTSEDKEQRQKDLALAFSLLDEVNNK